MEEECQELDEVILDVVVGLLQAQDTGWEEGLALIAHQHGVAIPGEEPKLEEVLHHHHHLWGCWGQRVAAGWHQPPCQPTPAHLSEDDGSHPEALAGPRDGKHGPEEDEDGQEEGDDRGGHHVVEDDDEVAEELRVGGHAAVPSQQQLQEPVVGLIELLCFLQLRELQLPEGSRGGHQPHHPKSLSPPVPTVPTSPHLLRRSSLAVRLRFCGRARSS